MPRYADIDKLLETFDADAPMNWNDTESEIQEQRDFEYYRGIVENAPIADVAEVVRCKNCKHWRYYCTDPIINYEYGNCLCHQWENAEFVPNTTSNDFCSYGEKGKTNELKESD